MDLPVLSKRGRAPRPAMVEVAASDVGGLRVHGQPHLGQRSLRQIVWRPGPAHLRRHPARLHRVGGYVRPSAGDDKRQGRVQQLGVGVRLRAVPAPLLPLQISEVRISGLMHARAQVDQPVGALDQRGEQEGRQDIDHKHVLQPILGLSSALSIADTRVVDHRVKPTLRVHRFGELPRSTDTRKIAHKHPRGPRRTQ